MEAVITHKRWKKTGIFKAHQRDFKCKIQQQNNIEGYISMNVLALAAIALNLVLVEAASDVASALSFPSFQSFFTLKSTVGCTMSSAQVMLAHQTVARCQHLPCACGWEAKACDKKSIPDKMGTGTSWEYEQATQTQTT